MKRIVLPILVILVFGTAAGLGFNQGRSKNRINLSRNYFAVAGGTKPPQNITSTDPADADDPTNGDSDGTASGESALSHPFTPVTLDEVVELYLSEEYLAGKIAFVDARDEKHFAEEHIIGSIHIDNYNADQMYDDARDALMTASTIVVYCGGGDCEDSIFLASYLTDRGIPIEKIRLFEGGMKAWLNDNLEVEQGTSTP